MSRRKPERRYVDCRDCHETFRSDDGGALCPRCDRRRKDAAIAEKRQAEALTLIDAGEPDTW